MSKRTPKHNTDQIDEKKSLKHRRSDEDNENHAAIVEVSAISSMTVAALKAELDDHGVKYGNKDKKAVLIALLLKANESEITTSTETTPATTTTTTTTTTATTTATSTETSPKPPATIPSLLTLCTESLPPSIISSSSLPEFIRHLAKRISTRSSLLRRYDSIRSSPRRANNYFHPMSKICCSVVICGGCNDMSTDTPSSDQQIRGKVRYDLKPVPTEEEFYQRLVEEAESDELDYH
ncbi:hypothetical protein TrLO_g3637 [Triparma laevis f. longispina]|uniref:HeH/LEM domain-containing protein n=1 Tax=Triparma laevis f. longispina TaxID=1714387 RepID=A0A9W7KZB9_9STRA|nr:hypothetical protein TrLO_g3637 [Triparma laevis f. longispina]